MQSISFRSAELQDLAILLEFEQGIVSTERPFDATLQGGTIYYYDIKAMIEATDTEVMVGEVNGDVVASAYVTVKQAKPYFKHDRYAYVGFLYVKPEHRGKNFSQRMLDELKIWSLARGLHEFRLDVYDANVRAVSAYLKFGFEKQLVEMRMSI